MPDAIIDRIDPTDLELVTHLHNSLFRPERDEAWFARRLEGRSRALIQVARIDKDAVGFYIGFELKPITHFAWLVGVVPELRRTGIATQLMHAAAERTRAEGYHTIRFECDNRIRPFLHFGIENDYDITGIRWDSDRLTNLVIFEKSLDTPTNA
jgi:GNAT superfamily N-acetyltransferase